MPINCVELSQVNVTRKRSFSTHSVFKHKICHGILMSSFLTHVFLQKTGKVWPPMH